MRQLILAPPSAWERHDSLNCFEHSGAHILRRDQPLIVTLAACQEACQAQPNCAALVRIHQGRESADEGRCWLRSAVHANRCSKDPGFDTFVSTAANRSRVSLVAGHADSVAVPGRLGAAAAQSVPPHYHDAAHLARVKQLYPDVSPGKFWRLTFHRPEPAASLMEARQLELLGPWMDASDATRRMDPIPPDCNCSYWPAPVADQLFQPTFYPEARPHFRFGAHARQVVDALLAAHIDGALRTNVVPRGNLFSLSLPLWAEWFAEHLCCAPSQMRAHTQAAPASLRAYGWLSDEPRAAGVCPALTWDGAVALAAARKHTEPGLAGLMARRDDTR